MSESSTSSGNQSFISLEDDDMDNQPKAKLKTTLRENHSNFGDVTKSVHELLSDSESTASSGSVSIMTNGNEEEVQDEDGDRDMNLILSALEKSVSNSALKKGNKTFSEDKIRDIEHTNTILMKKILYHNRRENQFSSAPKINKISSSALNRKKQQRQIDHDNLILLRKIQSVKPAVSRTKQ